MLTRILYTPALLLLCLLGTSQVYAQSIELNETTAIKQMMEKWTQLNRTTTRLEAWRIQVAASTDRYEVEGVKEKFASLYPTIACDWYQERPYYKIKAGAYRHAWEARRVIASIRADFPAAYPVFDKKVKPSDFMPVAQ